MPTDSNIAALPRTGTGIKLYIKRPTATEWVIITDAKNIQWPKQPKTTKDDEYPAAGITEKIKDGGQDGGEISFNIGVKTANDAGLLAVAASKMANEEVQIKGVYSNDAGYTIERVLIKSCELTEAKKGEICAFEVSGDCNSVMTPITATE